MSILAYKQQLIVDVYKYKYKYNSAFAYRLAKLTFRYSLSRTKNCSRIRHSRHIAIANYENTSVTKLRIFPSSVNTASKALVWVPPQKFQHSVILGPFILGKWTEMVGKSSNDQVLARFCDNRSTVSRVQTGGQTHSYLDTQIAPRLPQNRGLIVFCRIGW